MYISRQWFTISSKVWECLRQSPSWLPPTWEWFISSYQSGSPGLLWEVSHPTNKSLHHQENTAAQTGDNHRGVVVLTFLALQLWWDWKRRKLSYSLSISGVSETVTALILAAAGISVVAVITLMWIKMFRSKYYTSLINKTQAIGRSDIINKV